jgi:hypothetical protein
MICFMSTIPPDESQAHDIQGPIKHNDAFSILELRENLK